MKRFIVRRPGSRPVVISCHRVVWSLLIVCALAAVDVGLRPAPAAAQLTTTDSAAVLLRTAALFEEQGRGEVAAALYAHIVERYGSTPAAEQARARLAAAPAERQSRSGNVELQVWSTVYGLWLGVAVPAMLGADASEAFGAGLLLGGPTGWIASRSATRSRPLSDGQARAITWGGTWGTWQGLGWADVLDLGQDELCNEFACYDSGDGSEEMLASMVVGGLAGIATGAILARNPVRSGVASAAQGGALGGTWFGFAGAGLFDLGDDGLLAATLVGGNVGLVAGTLIAKRYDMSRNRVRLISLGGLVGILAGAGLDLLTQPDNEKVQIAIPVATSIAGIALAAHATRDYDRQAFPDRDAPGAALFGYDGAAWSLGAPMPMPTLRPLADDSGRIRWRPGIAFELFRATF